MDIKRLNPMQRWSDATVFNGIIRFVEVPDDTSTDMLWQIHQVLSQAEMRARQKETSPRVWSGRHVRAMSFPC